MKSPLTLLALLLIAVIHVGCASRPSGISREAWAQLTPAQQQERLREARQQREIMTDRDVRQTHQQLVRQAEALPKIRMASDSMP